MKMYRNLSLFAFCVSTMIILTGCQSDRTAAEPTSPAPAPVVEQAAQPEVPPAKAKVEPSGSKDAPQVTVENAIHDFGIMAPSSVGKCEFNFTNTGKSTLIIERVQSTCGCTVPELEKKEYAPGEAGTVKVTFKAPSRKGSVTKHLYIISNDPETPRTELTIKAKVEVQVEISPEAVDLRLDEENAGMPNLIVRSLDGREFSITQVTAGHGVMKVPFDSAEKAKMFILKPEVDKERLSQFITGVIQVQTDHPQSGTLIVSYNVKPEYEVSRSRIILQNVQPGVSEIKDVMIRSNYGKDVEIESVESKNGYMEIESQEKDGIHLQLQIKITPPQQDESSRRYITDQLDITLKDGTKLTIRCSGWFKLK